MRTQLSDQPPCLEKQGSRQRQYEGKLTPSRFGWILLIMSFLVMLAPSTAISKGGNSGRGGGSNITGVVVDYGDVFGDLIHILRDGRTGQPIYAQRWVEMPAELPGYGWGYCAIGIDADGEEIPFMPYSCDLDTTDADTVEVNYFGRLNGSRVQERNLRMHFNEAIINIKQSGQLKLDPVGRLMLGSECELYDPPGTCLWTTIDSPMENMSLYWRMLKYGHLSTDPEELDLWWHGDPKLPVPFHPALDADDFDKFIEAGLLNMLPGLDCWSGMTYMSSCARAQTLTPEDFDSSATFLGGSAGKGGIITDHLVQYLNRFLRITQSTEFAAATLATLPAMVRDCWPEGAADPWGHGEEPPADVDLTVDLEYGLCSIYEATANIPNYADFSNVQELFLDFEASGYDRDAAWSSRKTTLALEYEEGVSSALWALHYNVYLLDWIKIPNPQTPAEFEIHNFVDSANDALRAIEYIHNYEIPVNLYCKYETSYCE